MTKLNEVLDKGIPVGLQVGTFHLPFFPPEYRMHYNMHNMVVYGHENGIYFISDTLMDRLVEITYDDLVRVRYAKGVFAPEGRMYYPTIVPKDIDIKPAIIKGIRKTANNMVGVPFPLIGVKGIRYLAKSMRKWEKKLGPEKASYYLGQVLRMEEEVGTAGAGFRFIYGAFLNEAADVLKQEWLREVSYRWEKTPTNGESFLIKVHEIVKKGASPRNHTTTWQICCLYVPTMNRKSSRSWPPSRVEIFHPLTGKISLPSQVVIQTIYKL
jgi:hypothetical protein